MIIFRYLNKQIMASFVATTLVLLVIFLSNQLVHNLNEAASGKVTVHAVLLVTAIQLPILLAYMLPLGLFLGILLALGRLYVDHEMVVLSACGVSKQQVVAKIMVLALAITVLDAWLVLFAQPYLSALRGTIVNQSAQTATLDKILEGRFQLMGDANHVFYAGVVNKSEGYFGDVLVAMREKGVEQAPYSWTVLSSDTVREQEELGNGKFFVFEQGNRYLVTPGEKSVKQLKFKEFWQRLPNAREQGQNRYSAMKTASLLGLYGQDAHAAAELQWRLVNVLSTLLFALLAIPLGKVNPRKGKFAQLLPAILIYVAYANMMFATKSWLKNEKIPVFIGMWWIPVLLLVIALLLLWERKNHANS